MTVRELIEKLNMYDPDYPVRVLNSENSYPLLSDEFSIAFSYTDGAIGIENPQVILIPDAFRAENVEKVYIQ